MAHKKVYSINWCHEVYEMTKLVKTIKWIYANAIGDNAIHFKLPLYMITKNHNVVIEQYNF